MITLLMALVGCAGSDGADSGRAPDFGVAVLLVDCSPWGNFTIEVETQGDVEAVNALLSFEHQDAGTWALEQGDAAAWDAEIPSLELPAPCMSEGYDVVIEVLHPDGRSDSSASWSSPPLEEE